MIVSTTKTETFQHCHICPVSHCIRKSKVYIGSIIANDFNDILFFLFILFYLFYFASSDYSQMLKWAKQGKTPQFRLQSNAKMGQVGKDSSVQITVKC